MSEFVQVLSTDHAVVSATDTITLGAAGTVTAGNDIIVFLSTDGIAAALSVADDLGNTYQLVTANDVVATGVDNRSIWRATNVLGGTITTFGIVLDTPEGMWAIIALEYSGLTDATFFGDEWLRNNVTGHHPTAVTPSGIGLHIFVVYMRGTGAGSPSGGGAPDGSGVFSGPDTWTDGWSYRATAWAALGFFTAVELIAVWDYIGATEGTVDATWSDSIGNWYTISSLLATRKGLRVQTENVSIPLAVPNLDHGL